MKLPDTSLVIDMGNSRTKWAVFTTAREAIAQGVWTTVEKSTVLSTITNHLVDAVILSTVADEPSEDLEAALRQRVFYVQLTQDSLLPFQNTYRTPATIGKDRLAAVAGAQALFPQANSLVVDAGTCITSDFLAAGKVFKGGNISPGLRMRLRAMHDYTARLPLVHPIRMEADVLLGDSTENALRHGAVIGAALEIDGLLHKLEEHYGEVKLILTGGDTTFLVPFLKKKIFVQPNLVLIGLNQILKHNAKHFA